MSSRRITSGRIPFLLLLVASLIVACSGSSSSPILSQPDPSGTDPETPAPPPNGQSNPFSNSQDAGSQPQQPQDAGAKNDASKPPTDAGNAGDAGGDAGNANDAGSACDTCVATSCAAQRAACMNDPICVALKQCLDACADSDCRSACFDTFPNAAAKTKNGALYKCECITSCSTECAATCD